MSYKYEYICPQRTCRQVLLVSEDDLGYKKKHRCRRCGAVTHWRPRYPEGSKVWLAAFYNGLTLQPREAATVNPQTDSWWAAYSGSVKAHDRYDDGEREFSEDQIEGWRR